MNDAVAQRSRWKRLWMMAALGGLVTAPAGWFGTDVLERNNDFCNACHLREGVPLHIDIRRDFDARPVATLAALHASVAVETSPPSRAFRCIDCHGGSGLLGKARVKALAAKDAFWWATGHFDEPEGMRWPLLDADCRRCHGSFEPAAGAESDGQVPAFHALGLHNVELGVDCVECHFSHDRAPNTAAYFLDAERVRRQCARCHLEFEEG